jgi:hypothetical protein
MKPILSFNITRREFIKNTAVATAGVAVTGLNAADSKPLNFNSDMEYRRLGKTGIMVSAVCLGGHWKRVDTVVSGAAVLTILSLSRTAPM